MPVPGYTKRFPASGASKKVIAMRSKEWTVFDQEIEAASKARLESTMKEYCRSGPEGFPDSLFKFLEHFEAERVKVRLEEFKARGVRLFGFCGDDAGTSTFFVTGSDTAKKQRKANATLVALAGKEAVRLIRILRGPNGRSKGKGR